MATARSAASMARCHSPRICSARPTAEPAEDAREGVADALGDLDALAGVQQGGLRLAGHVAEVGRVQMAEADDLEVALLAGDAPAAVDQAAGFVELTEDRRGPCP